MNGSGLYQPEPALEPWTTYQIATRTRGKWSSYDLRVRAVAWRDDQAPQWLGSPRVKSASYQGSCMGDTARIELEVPVVDQTTVQIQFEARPLIGSVQAAHAVQVVNEGCAAMAWWIWPEGVLVPGMPYVATICAEDAAGNRSCAPQPVLFVAPRPGEDPADDLGVGTALRGELERAPPSDWMPRARPVRDQVDWPQLWRIVRWPGLAFLLLVVAVLRRARVRRAARAA